MATIEALLIRTFTDPTRALLNLIRMRHMKQGVTKVIEHHIATITRPESARITPPPTFDPLTHPSPPPSEEYIPPAWFWKGVACDALWYGLLLALLLFFLWLLWDNYRLRCSLASAPGNGGPGVRGGAGGSAPGGSGPNGNCGPGGNGAPGGSGSTGNGNGGNTGPPPAPPSAPGNPFGGFGSGGNGSTFSPLPSGPPPPPSAAAVPITANPAPASVSTPADLNASSDFWIVYTIIVVLGFAVGCTSYEIPWTFAEPALSSLVAVNKLHCTLFLLTHGYHLRGWYMSAVRATYEHLTDWHERQYSQYLDNCAWKVIYYKKWLVHYVPVFVTWLGHRMIEYWPSIRRFLILVWQRFISPLIHLCLLSLCFLLNLGCQKLERFYRYMFNLHGPDMEEHFSVLDENAYLTSRNAELASEIAELADHDASKQRTIHEQDKMIVHRDDVIRRHETKITDQKYAIERLDKEVDKQRQKHGDVATEKGRYKMEASQLKEAKIALKKSNGVLRDEVSALKVKALRATLDRRDAQTQTELEPLPAANVEDDPTVKELRSTVKTLETSNETLQTQINAANHSTNFRINSLETENASLSAAKQAGEKELASVQTQLAISCGETQFLRSKVAVAEQDVGKMSGEIEELKKTVTELQAQASEPLTQPQPARKVARAVGHRRRLAQPSNVPEQPPQAPTGQPNTDPVVDKPVPTQAPDGTNPPSDVKPVPIVDPVPNVNPQPIPAPVPSDNVPQGSPPPPAQKPPSGRKLLSAPKPPS
ncbi:MAG: hypothetical protein Q9211_004152, partial [Gyalolechia sp. 1 TL-2023]